MKTKRTKAKWNEDQVRMNAKWNEDQVEWRPSKNERQVEILLCFDYVSDYF